MSVVKRRKDDSTRTLKTAARPGHFALVLGAGSKSERRIVLDQQFTIGSGGFVDIHTDDPHVSEHHAELRNTPDGPQIRDLGSRNGTFVDGVRVNEAYLKNGSVITVGKTDILVLQALEDGTQSPPTDGPRQFGDVVGETEVMRRMFSILTKIAPTDLTVALIGETGTGKDLLARAIHETSPRRDQPFVVFDCGAAAAGVIESTLFGHSKGAFTDAVRDHAGVFERADGGTLLLDEIGELRLDLQPKLLRALETRTISRLGDAREKKVDLRIIAATNRDLEEEVRAGRFREDLYFRLSQALVRIPPLRERRDDIPLIVDILLERMETSVGVSPDTMAVLRTHNWPGNVRELRNVIASAAAVTTSSMVEPHDLLTLRASTRGRESTLDRIPLAGKSLEAIEAAAIRQTLDKFDGNKTKAAAALGIAQSTLYEKIKKYRNQ